VEQAPHHLVVLGETMAGRSVSEHDPPESIRRDDLVVVALDGDRAPALEGDDGDAARAETSLDEAQRRPGLPFGQVGEERADEHQVPLGPDPHLVEVLT
jgi:hypothetical protein